MSIRTNFENTENQTVPLCLSVPINFLTEAQRHGFFYLNIEFSVTIYQVKNKFYVGLDSRVYQSTLKCIKPPGLGGFTFIIYWIAQIV